MMKMVINLFIIAFFFCFVCFFYYQKLKKRDKPILVVPFYIQNLQLRLIFYESAFLVTDAYTIYTCG